ncbi:MAG: tripartite tricarboxylate transporter TctB family protein [SAR324 cluster bacterium]|nr:tripartite tricarboxylate transporter TctB family protein [SAR324 cluster bacterium]
MFLNRLKSQIGNLLLLSIGFYFLINSVVLLELGTARRMGPGYFPMLVGAIMCVLAIVTIVKDLKHPVERDAPDFLSVASVIGGVVAFAFVAPLLGVLPAVFLSVLATSSAVSSIPWKTRFLLAVLASIGIWAVFVGGLQLPLETIRGF